MRDREIHYLCIVDMNSENLVSLFTLANASRLTMGAVRTISSGSTIIEFVATGGDAASAAFIGRASRFASVSVASIEDISETLKSESIIPVTEPCTLCIVKPHVIKAHESGRILSCITDGGFTIRGVFSVHLSPQIAEAFLDVYRDIYVPYSAMIEQICSSPVLAVMVTSSRSASIVEDFRELAGPLNPEVAKAIRSESIRAKFGLNKAQNAVHCTDLPEDGEMECRYIFDTVAGTI